MTVKGTHIDRFGQWAAMLAVSIGLLLGIQSGVEAADVTITSDTTYSSSQVIDTLSITNASTLTINGSADIRVTNLRLTGTNSRIVFGSSNARLTVSGTATLSGSSSRIEGSSVTISGGTWNLSGSSARIVGNVTMDVANLAISSSAYISATGYGFGQNSGPGAGTHNPTSQESGSGASHGSRGLGAYGNSSTLNYYGSALQPTLAGSGGGSTVCYRTSNRSGGAGGGVIRLQVSGTLSLLGNLQSNGANGAGCPNTGSYAYYRGAGGGAAGSIWVDTNILTGTGYFYANGGTGGGSSNSYRGGGGGGGRIAVYTNNRTGFTRPYSSTVRGGYGYQGKYAANGTLAFIERGSNIGSRSDDKIFAFSGWRFEGDDGDYNMALFDAYNSTQVHGPDANDIELNFSTSFRLRSSAIWRADTNNTVLTTPTMTMDSSSQILGSGRTLGFNIGTAFTMNSSSRINTRQVNVTGTSTARLISSANILADVINWAGTNLTLDSSANFNVSGRGFASATGTGKGTNNGTQQESSSGGGHGGRGRAGYGTGTFGNFYGKAKTPTDFGSGGGSTACYRSSVRPGGAGGGRIRVQLSGTLTHAGYFYANGAGGVSCPNTGSYSYYRGSGAGAGGSIWVTTNILAGAGRFEAMGGLGGGGSYTYKGGGGGGGRILVEYNTANSFTSRKSSSVQGGNGFQSKYAENGTMAFRDRDDNDLLIVEGWRWQNNDGVHSYRNLSIEDSTRDSSAEVISDGNALVVTASGAITMDSGSIWRLPATAQITANDLNMTTSQILGTTTTITLGGTATLNSSAKITSDTRLEIKGSGNWTMNSSVQLRSNDMFWNDVGSVSLNNSSILYGNVRGKMVNLSLLRSNAHINADGYGFGQNSGPGAGTHNPTSQESGSGASHGGAGSVAYGNTSVRPYYGSAKSPTLAGSGGGSTVCYRSSNRSGGAGGGVINLEVTGTLHNDGYMYANGASGTACPNTGSYAYYRGSGGGSGGTIKVATGALAGTGYFFADGGTGGGSSNSYRGGGGGGGRVAVTFDSTSFTRPQSSSVTGGYGYLGKYGEVGTMAFIMRGDNKVSTTDDTYFIYEGWRWQSNDGQHVLKRAEYYNYSLVTGPDTAGQVFNFSDHLKLGYDATWNHSLANLSFTSNTVHFDDRSDLIGGSRNLLMNVAGAFTMDVTSRINSKNVTMTGTATAQLISTASVHGDTINWTSKDLNLSSSASFNVNGRGSASGVGTGKGTNNGTAQESSSGGGHGGAGRAGYGTSTFGGVYGKAKSPTEKGSGGGSTVCYRSSVRNGGAGGGSIRVQVSNNLVVNGYFYANGAGGVSCPNTGSYSYYRGSGAGAGGSIWVTTNILAGAGRFEAVGGLGGGGSYTYKGGGGGGGRIFIEYNSSSDFTNRKYSSVLGGNGFQSKVAENGTLAFYDRNDNDLFVVEGWRWQNNDGAHTYNNLSIEDSTRDSSAGVIDDSSNFTVNVADTLTMDSGAVWTLNAGSSRINADNLVLANAQINGPNTLVLNVTDSARMDSSSRINVTNQLEIKGEGDWVLNSSAQMRSKDMFWNEGGSVTLNSSAKLYGNVRGKMANLAMTYYLAQINADGYGFGQNSGPGAGTHNGTSQESGSGASHGGVGKAGYGNNSVRAYYDSSKLPAQAGSGGGSTVCYRSSVRNGGAGGGVINLEIAGNLRNEGYFYANGANGVACANAGSYSYYRGSGAGAGGAIRVQAGALTGGGYFVAQGGTGGGSSNTYKGGGGGGGRIAVYFNSWNFTRPQSSNVNGGSGFGGTAERGTLAFIHRGVDPNTQHDDQYHVYGGWRWQQGDLDEGKHRHGLMDVYNSSLVRGPDSDEQPLEFSGNVRLRSSATWQPDTHSTIVSMGSLTMDSSSNIRSSTKNLQMTIGGDSVMQSSSYIDAKKVTVLGTSSMTMNSSAKIVSDNIQWTGRNLTTSTSANFNVTGRGYNSVSGPGAGYHNGTAQESGSGASHGGEGYVAYGNNAVRKYYGSATDPITAGSGGGSTACYRSSVKPGGRGGGIIRLQLSGTFNHAGYFYANGANGVSCPNTGSYAYYRGSGAGAGGAIWVTTSRLTGRGRFEALGGTGGGSSNTYRGGGGGGGRIFIDYEDPTGFTSPQYSTVRGGSGFKGAYGNNGTLAFFERDVNDLWIVEGWRWQQGDAPFSYRNLKVTDSTTDSSAWVRDDGASTRVDVGVLFSMDSSAYWQSTATLLDLRTTRLTFANSRLSAPALSLQVAGAASMTSSSQIDGASVRIAGSGAWTLNSSARMISNDLFFDSVGSVILNSSSHLKGNVRGIMRDLRITSSSGYIAADGYGFTSNTGSGAGYHNGTAQESGSGASYGGQGSVAYGNNSVRAYYGDALAPTFKGSGGGSTVCYRSTPRDGGAGGGAINLVISNELENDGQIRANGGNGIACANAGSYSYYRGSGGGSGGTVLVDTNKLQGTGYFYANGGTGGGSSNTYRGGGGGGGRIFVKYNENTGRSTTYMPQIQANGGYGFKGTYGEKGTSAYYDKDDRGFEGYYSWRWQTSEEPFEFDSLYMHNSTYVRTEGPTISLDVNGSCNIKSSVNWQSTTSDLQFGCQDFTMDSGSRIEGGDSTVTLTTTGNVILNGSAYLRSRVLAVLGSGIITMNSSSAMYGNLNLTGQRLNLTRSSKLQTTGYGYLSNSGPGAGTANPTAQESGSGGGHGGRGYVGHGTGSFGGTYGNIEAPITGGSGGGSTACYRSSVKPGGGGGGSLHINMTEEIRLDGYIYADGGAGVSCPNTGSYSYYRGSGGGAGGGVWIETFNLLGSGRVYSRGGLGGGGSYTYKGGGGGGGRIAVCVSQGSFSGTFDVAGGHGYRGGYAEAGSFYNACEPILPEAAIVVGRGRNNPRATIVAPGTTDQPVFQFRVREITNRNGVTFNTIRVNADGNGDDLNHLTSIKLYHDVDGDGEISDGDVAKGEGRYSANNGQITFNNIGLTLAPNASTHFLVTYSWAENGLPNNVYYRARIADHQSMDLVTEGTDHSVPLYGTATYGYSHRVYQTPPPYVSNLSPRTVSQGVDSFITLYGGYFNGATAVKLDDFNNTPLTITSIYRSGTRMGVRIPGSAPTGTYNIQVTTPHGTNATSRYRLTIQASCNTGLLGICAAGTDRGDGCVPRYTPGQVSEVCGNGVDESCNGEDLDCRFVDADGDGFSPADGDCDDSNRTIFPREGLGCSAARDDLSTNGVPRAVVTYTPLEDGDGGEWAQNANSSWYQQAAETLMNSAAVFESEGAYAEVPDSIFLQPFGDKATMGAWVRMETVPTTGNYMIAFKGPSGGESYAIWYDAAHKCWVATIQTTTGRHVVRSSVLALAPKAWTHVSFAYNGAQLVLYLNGVAVGTTACSGNLVHTNSVMRVGGGQAGYKTWVGQIDEVVLFGRVVSRTDILDMVRLNRLHQRRDWGNNGPVVRFSYDFGAFEHNRRISGSFRGNCRITGRSSMPHFPTFCSIVGTTGGFEIWDEPSGELWARYFIDSRISGSGIKLPSVDYVASAYGRIYLGSHTGVGGMVVLDYRNDKVEHWSTDGVRTFNGGVGVINRSVGYGAVDGSGMRMPTNIIRRLRGWTRNGTTPYVGIGCDEGVWTVEGNTTPQISSIYLPRHDNQNPSARNFYRLLTSCGVHPVGDSLYFGMVHRDNSQYDVLAAAPYRYPGIDRRSFESMVQTTSVPSTWHTVYGRSGGNPIWSGNITANINWGGVRDVVIMPNASRHPNADGDDHIIALATPEGVVMLDQANSGGDTTPMYSILKGEDNGVSDDTTKYVLHSNVNDCSALGLRGGELFVGTNGAGVTRLNFSEDENNPGEFGFEQLEYYTSTTGVELPSNNVTAVSCGKNALVATDAGVASIRFPEPGPCTVEGAQGVCATGREYLVGNSIQCVQTIFPRGETCDNLDNDCDGTPDEHPEVGSICDRQEPTIEQGENISITSIDCDGAVVVLPTPAVHDNNDQNPTLTNDAPARYPFGRTTVTWRAEDKDGHVSTMTQFVTVNYDGQPEITVPDAVSTEASSPLGTPVSIGQAVGTICVPGGVTFTNDAPARFPVGATTVTWTGRGQQGRPVTGTQTVTIVDTTAPSIEVGDDLTFDIVGDIVMPTPVLSDNGTPANQIVVTNNAPDTYPVAEWVTVTFTATDSAGNRSTDSLRIFVRFLSAPPPVITIETPSHAWHKPPVTMSAVVDDGNCTEAPDASVNSVDLTADVTHLGGGRWRVETSRVSDGQHALTITVTSGCTNKSANATRIFGVDSGGITVQYAGINQSDVEENNPSTWPSFSDKSRVPGNVILRDDFSGLASYTSEVINVATNASVALGSKTFTERSGDPERGKLLAAENFCTNGDHCTDGKLDFDTLEGTNFLLKITVIDTVGNVFVANYYFRSLGLREAIVAWNDAAAQIESDSGEAEALLIECQAKLTQAVIGYDTEYWGNMWLAVEDAHALVRQARVFDNTIELEVDALLVATLGSDFQQALSLNTQNDSGPLNEDQEASYDEAARRVGLARANADADSPGDAFLDLANSFFWMEDGRVPMKVDENSSRVFRDLVSVLDVIIEQMDDYLNTRLQDGELPGKNGVREVYERLLVFQEYQEYIVECGDTCPTNLRHMQNLMRLTDSAVDLKELEQQSTWVRNWQYGLTQVVFVYSKRAILNAGTWVGQNHTLLGDARESLDDADIFRGNKRADDFMEILIDSRCMINGIYNFVYPNEKVEVPEACCDLLIEYKERESRIEIPEQCLETIQVEIEGNGFSEETINASVGQQVRWINRDRVAHTITGGTPGDIDRDELDSGSVAPNGVFTHTFDTPGTYLYFSETNPGGTEGTRVIVTN